MTTTSASSIAPSSTLAPSLSSSSYNGSNDTILVFVTTAFFISLIVVIIWIWHVFSKRKYPTDTDDEINNIDIHTIWSAVASSSLLSTEGINKIISLRLRLSLENRIQLYKKTFDSNGNQTTLKGKHIIVTQTMMNNTREVENIEEKEKNTDHIDSIIDVELGDNHVSSKDDDDDDDDDGDENSKAEEEDNANDDNNKAAKSISSFSNSESNNYVMNDTRIRKRQTKTNSMPTTTKRVYTYIHNDT